MKELILVRHGEAEHIVKGLVGGGSDYPLTNKGRKQAALTGKRLEELYGTRIEGIYSSDLKRASESATIIQNEINAPITMNPQLREMNRGIAEGMSVEEAKKIQLRVTKPQLDWIPYPEGESWRMMQERASKALSEMKQKSEDVILIVGHGNIISSIIELWLQFPEGFNLDFVIHPASITVLGESVWGYREIRKLNETAFLTGAGLDYRNLESDSLS
ncbi:MAG: histidine phosphatase family protein [Candidatus Thorarchaeota archaeon]